MIVKCFKVSCQKPRKYQSQSSQCLIVEYGRVLRLGQLRQPKQALI